MGRVIMSPKQESDSTLFLLVLQICKGKKISTAFLCEESRLNGTYSLADSLSGPASLPVPAIVYQGDLDCRSGCLHVKEEMYIGLSALLLFDVLKGD